MFYVGGDTLTCTEDLFCKEGASTANCNMRVYHADIDPANLPSPSDPIWNEVTNQTLINKLKEQNSDQTIETATNTFEANSYYHNAPTDGSVSVKLEGSTLKNEVVNGNFADGTTGWTGVNLSASNNICKYTPTAQYGGITQTFSDYAKYKGHKLYFSANVKTDTVNNILVLNDGLTQVGIQHTGDNTFRKLSGTMTINANATVVFTKIQDGRSSGWTETQVKDFIIIDLTALGLESKTVAELDAMTQVYFDGIKSTGENQGGEGIHKIEVLSKGKNLCLTELENQTITATTLFDDYPIKVKPNTNYTIKITNITALNGSEFQIKAQDKTTSLLQIYNQTNVTTTNIINTGISNCIYIKGYKSIGELNWGTIQLEQGTTATAYEPHKFDKIDILPTQPLRSLPNGTRDSISSGGVVTKRIGKVVLDGSEVWNYNSKTTNHIMFRIQNAQYNKANITPICNNFIGKLALLSGVEDSEGVVQHTIAGGSIFISIIISKLTSYGYIEGNSSTYVTSFKAWLQANSTTVYYELATPTTEKVNPLLLQSYKNGTLEVDSDIPSKTTETHNTDINDYSVLSISCSEVGKSKSLMVETTMQNIINSLYGGSVTAFRSAFQRLKGNIWSSKANIKTWNGAWVSNVSNANSNISNTNYEMTDNTIIRDDNNIYIMCCAGDSAIVGTPSILNVDYIDIKTDLSRVADVITLGTAKTQTFGETWSLLLKELAFENVTNPKPIKIDTTEFNLSNLVSGDRFRYCNTLIQQNNENITIYLLNNNGVVSSEVLGTRIIGTYDIEFLSNDYFLESPYFLNDRNFSSEEIEVILKGRNTIVGKETDTTLNELAEMFANPLIPTGYILPNNRYIITGQATLYCNGYFTRTVQDCEFTTSKWENKIVLVSGAEVRRLD